MIATANFSDMVEPRIENHSVDEERRAVMNTVCKSPISLAIAVLTLLQRPAMAMATAAAGNHGCHRRSS